MVHHYVYHLLDLYAISHIGMVYAYTYQQHRTVWYYTCSDYSYDLLILDTTAGGISRSVVPPVEVLYSYYQ